MVVFTGDQINGQGSSWDEKSVLPIWLEPIVRRKLPWAAIFGNHDSESGFLSRREQMTLLQQYPYSLCRPGRATIHGEGNFDVPVRSPYDGSTALLSLWFFDSGNHAPFSILHPLDKLRYDWVRDDQIDWFRERSREYAAVPRPYKPPANVSSSMERRRSSSHSLRPPGIVFVHIPVPEAFDEVDSDAHGNGLVIGERQEKHSLLGAQLHRGLFDAAVLQRKEPDASGVQLFVHGHMHNNEDCRRVRGMWICFGGGASYAAYGKLGFQRRARVFRVSDWGERIATYHRFDDRKDLVDEVELR